MQPDGWVTANGRAELPADSDMGAELGTLREECRRQALVIDTLGEAIANFNRGAKALKDENSELRAENDRLRGSRRFLSRTDSSATRGELVEAAIPVCADAPATARAIVAECLADHVASSVLEIALLLVSELVTNSVIHSGATSDQELILRVHLWGDRCRLEVEDPGRDGVIAPKPEHLAKGAGLGLNLVQSLSERWGVVRAADGPTRVWSQLRCSATPARSA